MRCLNVTPCFFGIPPPLALFGEVSAWIYKGERDECGSLLGSEYRTMEATLPNLTGMVGERSREGFIRALVPIDSPTLHSPTSLPLLHLSLGYLPYSPTSPYIAHGTGTPPRRPLRPLII